MISGAASLAATGLFILTLRSATASMQTVPYQTTSVIVQHVLSDPSSDLSASMKKLCDATPSDDDADNEEADGDHPSSSITLSARCDGVHHHSFAEAHR